jgi:hypothetical protein
LWTLRRTRLFSTQGSSVGADAELTRAADFNCATISQLSTALVLTFAVQVGGSNISSGLWQFGVSASIRQNHHVHPHLEIKRDYSATLGE